MNKLDSNSAYIGADDLDLDLFESQFVLPEGMSYNSYPIMDGKVAVMDSCDARKGEDWKRNLLEALEGRKPDYIVVHHMEPDHSAMLAWAMSEFPGLVLVASAKAIQMYGQFFDGPDISSRTIAVKDGRKCNCGLHGCLETYCSAIGVSRTVAEVLANSDKPSILRDLDQTKPISSYEVFKAAEQGDELAKEIFKITGELMGTAFADFVKFSAPEAIVLFGGLAKAGKYLDEHIIRSMNENQLPIWKNKVKLLHSTLKDSDAAILGASALAWEL